MSRIGKKPVAVPAGVKVAVAGRTVTVEGPKGKLEWEHPPRGRRRATTTRPSRSSVARDDDERQARALHGLTRALIRTWSSASRKGYEKKLEIVGVGYQAAVQGKVLQLRVGFANEVQMPIPDGLKVDRAPTRRTSSIQGIDKQMVGQFAAEVRGRAQAGAVQGQGHPLRGRSRSAARQARPWRSNA